MIQLGIPSFEEADELEPELNVRFDDFTPSDVKVWQRQSAYLHHFAKTGSVTASAREAGVAVFTAQLWMSRDVYGFNRRLEVSELEYCERLEELALERATQPNAPVSLLIAILRARMPEKYGRKDSEPDKDKEEAMIYNYTVRAQQEKADGYPVLQRIIQGDPDPFRDDPDREQVHAGAQDAGLDDDPPLDQDEFDYFDLSTDDDDDPHPDPSPTGDEIQRGGSPRHALAATGEEMSPHDSMPGTYPEAHSPHDSVGPARSQNGPPQNHEDLTRAARRQLQRQQKKQEKKNVFPVKRF